MLFTVGTFILVYGCYKERRKMRQAREREAAEAEQGLGSNEQGTNRNYHSIPRAAER